MRALVIYARPDTKGHGPIILDLVKKGLKKRAINFEVLDLYSMGYDPVLSGAEHYTSGHYKVSPNNRKIQEKIKKADALVFIYPVWWYGPPAILKGFFDRVLTPRFAFRYSGPVPKGLLKGKRAAAIMSMGGPRLYYMLSGNLPKRNFTALMGFCGMKSRVFQIGSARKMAKKRLPLIKKAVNRALSWL
jgi:NAD(P)H dehydrogenase (quinone)